MVCFKQSNHAHICTHTHEHTHTHTDRHTHTQTRGHTDAHVCSHACTHAQTHTLTHAHRVPSTSRQRGPTDSDVFGPVQNQPLQVWGLQLLPGLRAAGTQAPLETTGLEDTADTHCTHSANKSISHSITLRSHKPTWLTCTHVCKGTHSPLPHTHA